MKRTVVTSIFVLITLLLIGCSTNDNPTQSYRPDNVKINYLPLGVSDWGVDGSPLAGSGILGLFNLNIDPMNLKAEIIPLRETALTDVLESVDITNFLQLAPCTDCVKIKSVSRDINGNLVLSIGVKHPFNAGDPLKPITGRNRADLHVFNVEGIVVSNSTAKNFAGIGEKISALKLVNADGYTGYLDKSLDNIFPTDATIHPYILHFDDYSAGNFDPANPMGFESVTVPPPSGNLVMAMGCDYDYKDYVFDLGTNAPNMYQYIYAVGCTYAVSAANKQQRFYPEYRVPQHNKKAASEVKIQIVSNNLKARIASSTALLEIQVVDINHGVEVGTALNKMLADSSVESIKIEVPGVMNSPLSIAGNSYISGSGHSPSDPLVYQATITNSAGAEEGIYKGLVEVRDSYSPGLNTSPLLEGKDGIHRVDPIINPLAGLFSIGKFATYQSFNIEVQFGEVTVTSINPNEADQHSFVDNAVISGTNFVNVVSVRLEKGTTVIEAETFNVNSTTQITADFDLLGYPYGVYDVVVEVQGSLTGRLDDGFTINLVCGTTAPYLDNVYTLSPETNSNWVCAILNAGPYANYTIYPECNVYQQAYKVFNHMTQANNTPTIPWPAFGANGNALVMEPATSNGLMIVLAAYASSRWQVVNQTTGALVQTLPHNSLIGVVGDFDANNNFWAITNRRPDSSTPNVYTYHLQRWNYNPASPSTPYSLAAEYDVTSLFADYSDPTTRFETFGDLVILPNASYCYVLTGAAGTDDHKLDKVNLLGSAPTIEKSFSFAGVGFNIDAQFDIAQSRAVKMELDISDSDLIPCRLVVAGTLSTVSGDNRYLKVYRFDGDLNVLATATYTYNIASNYARKFYGMAIDMQNKVIVHLTEFPSVIYPPSYVAYYGVTKLPADW